MKPRGKALHGGTGRPRVLAVIARGCNRPRAYLGLVSSYDELTTTEQYKRLNDVEWATQVVATAPPEPEWTKPLLP